MPVLKAMDAVEGRIIATKAMLPRWEGFIVSSASTNMSAWEAIEAVKDLSFCMTQTLVEESGSTTPHVPSSYDFKKVSYHPIWSFLVISIWNDRLFIEIIIYVEWLKLVVTQGMIWVWILESCHNYPRLNRIFQVSVVPNRTVVDSDLGFDNLCCSHLQSPSELYHVILFSFCMKTYFIVDVCPKNNKKEKRKNSSRGLTSKKH